MVLEDLFSFDSMMFKSKGDVLGVSIFLPFLQRGVTFVTSSLRLFQTKWGFRARRL